MQAKVERKEPDHRADVSARKPMTLGDVATLSGEELILCFGSSTAQQLVDLIVAAIRKGDDDEVAAIDGRLQEVERLLRR